MHLVMDPSPSVSVNFCLDKTLRVATIDAGSDDVRSRDGSGAASSFRLDLSPHRFREHPVQTSPSMRSVGGDRNLQLFTSKTSLELKRKCKVSVLMHSVLRALSRCLFRAVLLSLVRGAFIGAKVSVEIIVRCISQDYFQ